MPAICAEISSVAFAVCDASCFTSEATTAKPRPASPARAASIVALSASRLVCSAIAVISLTTSPMRLAACDSAVMRASVFSACATASDAILLNSLTWRAISPTDEVISSVALATDCTLDDASSDAAATMPDSCCADSAVRLSEPAAVSSCDAAVVTVPTIPPMRCSKSAVSLPSCSPRCARCSPSFCCSRWNISNSRWP